MIKILKYSKLILLSYILKKKYNYYNKLSNKDYNILKNNINDCGCICIKCIQWLIPILEQQNVDESFINILNNLYYNCTKHDLKYTKDKYKELFYNDIDSEYEICGIVGSGSIAQVYKIKDKNGKYYAMKVKHPNIEKDIYLFKNIFNFLYKLSCFNNICYKYFPFNLITFLNDFYKQCDFMNESNNLIEFHKYYKDNNHIIIPELYKVSNDIIIMEYIEGTMFDDLEVSEYEKSKIIYLLYLFTRNNLIIHNHIHGDLHKYNWKILNKENNLYKLVIYDFGYCFKLNDEEYKYMCIISKLITSFDKDDTNMIKEYNEFLKYIYNDDNVINSITFNHNMTKPDILLKNILNISYEYNVFIKINKILNSLLLMCLLEKNFEKYNINNNEEPKKIKKNLLDTYSFCDTYKIFPKLAYHLLKEYKGTKQSKSLFETIEFNDKIKSLI